MLSVHLSMMQSHDEHVSTWLHFYPLDSPLILALSGEPPVISALESHQHVSGYRQSGLPRFRFCALFVSGTHYFAPKGQRSIEFPLLYLLLHNKIQKQGKSIAVVSAPGVGNPHGVDIQSQLYRWLAPSYQCQVVA